MNYLSTYLIVLILCPFICWQQKKAIIIRHLRQGCRCSLNCKLTQTGPLLQYCSITSHLCFARLCSVENLHPVCYTKQGRPSPEAIMHFPLFQISPYFRQIFRTPRKIPPI